jgi:hypothetical protein
MSTILYARATGAAEVRLTNAAVGASETPSEKLSALAQRIAALVPAEVLVIYGAILAAAVTQGDDGTTTINNPGLLKWSIPVLALTSLSVYSIAKPSPWHGADVGRMFVPPLAFVTWTLLTGSTALSLWRWFSWLHGGAEWLAGGVVALLILTLATRLTPTQ